MNKMERQIADIFGNKVRTNDKNVIIEKIMKLKKDGKNNLRIITDFDRTLSKHHNNGILTKSSFAVFETLRGLPLSYKKSAADLAKKYRKIEDDPNCSINEKIPSMEKWWTASLSLCVGLPYIQQEVDEAIIFNDMQLRDGTDICFKKLQNADIPILILSAGLGNVVESIMKYFNLLLNNVTIISNFLQIENEIITGLVGNMIHVYNKNEQNVQIDLNVGKRLNIILMGDSLGDAEMARGAPDGGTILKIGFLSLNIEEYLPQYLNAFDIVLLDDQTMDVFNAIIDFILNDI